MRKRQAAETPRNDENIIIERCKQGDLSAFDDLIRRYERQIYNFAYRMTHSYDDANDIVNEAFIKVFTAIRTFRGDANFSTWLYRIVTNLYLDSRKRARSHLTFPLDDHVDLEDGSVVRQVEDPAPGPSEMLEAEERNELLKRAIDSLPEYQKIMIILYHNQGLSYEDIAEVMGLPIGTVKSRLNRARLALKEKLAPARELFGL